VEQRLVLGVGLADLDAIDAGVLVDRDVGGVEDLDDRRQAERASGLDDQLEALAQRVRVGCAEPLPAAAPARAGLDHSAPQRLAARLLHHAGRLHDLRLALDRAGPRDDHQLVPAAYHRSDLHRLVDRFLRGTLLCDPLVRAGDRDELVDAGHLLELARRQPGDVAVHADQRDLLADHLPDLEAEIDDAMLYGIDLIAAGIAAHLDEHVELPTSRRLYGRDGHAIEPGAMRQGAARECVLALDVGTTGVRALVVDAAGTVVGEAYREALPHAPRPGLLEHDLDALLAAVTGVRGAALAGVPTGAIRGFGLAAQRATAVVWETASGRPVHPAISWQDQRAAARCARLLEEGVFVSPLTAATKLEWILDRVDADRRRVEAGKLRCGTLDAWLVTRLLGEDVFVTDGPHAPCRGLSYFATTGWREAIAPPLRLP